MNRAPASERVAIHADDVLRVDGNRCAAVDKASDTSIRHHFSHVEIGLGTDKVVDANRCRRIGGLRMRSAKRCERQGDDAGHG
ncbi:hypothetical protein G6F22_021934 [Rhizopus arrhizus]|nr:hypothetical protein G6F22_021934 [Rhizopus arrhizus]